MKTNNYFRIFIQRIIILAIIGLTVWLYGCKKESNSSNFVYPNFIDPNLFGTWRSNGNDVLAFKDNNVFLDSLYGCGVLTYVFRGHYIVKDGFIQLDDINVTYFIYSSDTSLATYNYFSPTLKIYQLSKDQLILTPTMIMSKKSANKDTLSGSWSTNLLVAAFDAWQNPHFVNGNDLREYSFFQDSVLVNHILHYGNVYDKYQGSLPYIYVTADSIRMGYSPFDSYKIAFSNNLLYLMSKNEIYQKVK